MYQMYTTNCVTRPIKHVPVAVLQLQQSSFHAASEPKTNLEPVLSASGSKAAAPSLRWARAKNHLRQALRAE